MSMIAKLEQLHRRQFLGKAAGVAAATALAPWATRARALDDDARRDGALLPRERIGIQLYTLRHRIGALGFEQVFRELADIGYSEVEFSGYSAPDTDVPGPTPPGTIPSTKNIRRLLERYRLKGVGSLVSVTQFRDNLQQVLEDAEALGLPYIGTPSEPDQLFPPAERETVDAYRRASQRYNAFGAAAKARGMKFYHHNHSAEFAVVKGTRLFDVLMAETDPQLVFFELDVFWIYAAATGAPEVPTPTGLKTWFPNFDPIELVWRAPQRFPLFHAKDGIRTEVGAPDPFGWQFVDVGDGHVPLRALFSGLDTDNHHFIVERDNHDYPPPGIPSGDARNTAQLKTAKRSYDYLAGLRER